MIRRRKWIARGGDKIKEEDKKKGGVGDRRVRKER